jgi:hypothetical protein
LFEFIFKIPQGPKTLKYISKYYITKAVNLFFDTLKSKDNIREEQLIGVIFKVRYNDDDNSIKSLSTYRKGLVSSKVSFTTLFKHLANIRSEDY